ncbi:methyltransferase domain-containing protein [Novosphingobium lentum]|uniref:methyltransferase domain-containing protein n=1 Tax=Novosphingobium lentum TaxID=145287 RepID=UPI00082D00C9|nr:methyltransferase domain-containing protein [Novosphingobium lentum]
MTTAPTIFSRNRRIAVRQRRRSLQIGAGCPQYLADDMVEDTIDRLGFLRHAPASALLIGDWTGALADALAAQGCAVTRADPTGSAGVAAIDEEQPLPDQGHPFIASFGTLDTVNDLPGALIHLRQALAPGGLLIASFVGAGSLPTLRAAMFAADGDRPAPRIHPMVDVRAGGQLMQRAGFADPVIDSRSLAVRFGSLDALVADLRAQALGNVLARPGPPLGKAALERARAALLDQADTDGRVTERFEILTLSGWRR